ncbi:MAG: CoA ester lyase, partial [Armatimonadetes bacterium]|nr:CoA ester lyase [Armatimonadota bacterium]
TPSQQAVDDAYEMLRLAEEAQAMGKGVAVKDGKFIGPPMVATARKVIARHELAQRRTGAASDE